MCVWFLCVLCNNQQAEKKAKEIQNKLETSNLLQSDSILGVHPDGSIDPDVATEQISTIVNIFAGPYALTSQDKEMMHTVISTVSTLLNPQPQNATVVDMFKQFEPLVQLLLPPMHVPRTHDDSLQTENLIAIDAQKNVNIDVKAVADLASQFVQAVSEVAQ